MSDLKDYIQLVEGRVSKYNFPKTPENLYDPLRYFMTLGGKRLRPVLTILTAELFEITPEESLPAALAIEFFHNFSLIHDDIMDEAPARRGKATVHTKWNRDIAILSGDVLLIEAYQQLSAYPDERLPKLFELFNRTAREVCEGQQMDMDFERIVNISKEEYIEMIRLKTSVLIGCAVQFGAIVGKAGESIQRELYQFGMELGIGFQIQDDLLDLYANPEKFGKQVGGDVLSNKKTLLLLNALEKDAATVHELMRMPADENKIQQAQQLFSDLGAVTATQNRMNSYYESALNHLNKLETAGYDVSILREISQSLMIRKL